jgi:hypothetical protein
MNTYYHSDRGAKVEAILLDGFINEYKCKTKGTPQDRVCVGARYHATLGQPERSPLAVAGAIGEPFKDLG